MQKAREALQPLFRVICLAQFLVAQCGVICDKLSWPRVRIFRGHVSEFLRGIGIFVLVVKVGGFARQRIVGRGRRLDEGRPRGPETATDWRIRDNAEGSATMQGDACYAHSMVMRIHPSICGSP